MIRKSVVLRNLLWILFLFGVLAERSGFAASPFYLTFERSFLSREEATLRLDFQTRDVPFVVRVLRPKSVETFLEGQFQLSRSYEEPRSVLNPGHFFWRGVNHITNPWYSLRTMLGVEARQMAGEKFSKPLARLDRRATASVPPEIGIAAPSGFDLVRELFVSVQVTGQEVSDTVPGFEDWESDRGGYQQRDVKLGKLPPGLYLVQVVQGKREAQAILQVTDLMVQVKQSQRDLVVRVVDENLDPVDDVRIDFRVPGSNKHQVISQVTDSDGQLLYRHSSDLPSRLILRATAGKSRSAYVDTEFLSTAESRPSLFLFTDRPIFKPGEKFFYKGIVRSEENGKPMIPSFSTRDIITRVEKSSGDVTGEEQRAAYTEFGTFSGDFTLGEQQEPGVYRIAANVDETWHRGELRVRDYVKPTFYMQFMREEGRVRPGTTYRAEIAATRFAGGPAAGSSYEVFVYRKKFEAPQWVDESGGGMTTGMSYYGQTRSDSGANQPQRIYSSLEERSGKGGSEEELRASAPKFDGKGVAHITIDLPAEKESKQEWVYSLVIRANDDQGAQAVLSKNFYETASEVVGVCGFYQPLVALGSADVKVFVRSNDAEGNAIADVGGDLIVELEGANGKVREFWKGSFRTDVSGVARLTLPKLKDPGRLRARALFKSVGQRGVRNPYETVAASLLVGGDDGDVVAQTSQLEAYAERDEVAVGAKYRILVLMPKGWGQSEHGLLWATVAGERVFAIKAQEAEGGSTWIEGDVKPEYGTGFYVTVSMARKDGRFEEQNVSFRVIKRESILDVAIKPERDFAAPLKPFKIAFDVKDSSGKGVHDAELAVSVIDKAVYAVQAEFRPQLYDFFFPIPRLNVMTFHAAELQGYGYADEIRRPNFQLEALKSATTILNKTLRDTAGWFPHVVPDANGHAEIVVNMPGNVTEWLVTALVVDKKGRVGEKTQVFRSAVDVAVTPVLPSVLRKGDTVNASIRVTNSATRDARVNLKLEGNGLGLSGGDESTTKIAVGENKIVEFSLKGTTSAGAGGLTVVASDENGLKVGGLGEYEIPFRPGGILQRFDARSKVPGETNLLAALPAQGFATGLEVRVDENYGLWSSVLASVRTLVQYPHGCTEQLVHSTVPNLVALDILKRASIAEDRMGEFAELMKKARENATVGFTRILSNQRSSGGFSLWADERDASIGPTLVALRGLLIAQSLGVKTYDDSIWRAKSYLERNEKDLERSLEYGVALPFSTVLVNILQPVRDAMIRRSLVAAEAPNARLDELVFSLSALQNVKGGDRGSERRKLVERIQAAVRTFDQAQDATARRALFQSENAGAFEFTYAAPTVISAALRVLYTEKELPDDVRNRGYEILMNLHSGGYWRSTFDSAEVIFNLRELLDDEAERLAKRETRKETLKVTARDGAVLGELKPVLTGYSGTWLLKDDSIENLLDLTVKGVPKNALIQGSFDVWVANRDAIPQSNGFHVERKLLKVKSDGGSEPLVLGAPLRVGDVIVSAVRVTRDWKSAPPDSVPSSLVLVEDAIPAFAEGVDADVEVLADAGIKKPSDSFVGVRETLRYPEKVVRVLKLAPWVSGVDSAIVWRVKFTGKASLPPVLINDMYDNHLRANTVGESLEAIK